MMFAMHRTIVDDARVKCTTGISTQHDRPMTPTQFTPPSPLARLSKGFLKAFFLCCSGISFYEVMDKNGNTKIIVAQ